jgi:hypothetical protein
VTAAAFGDDDEWPLCTSQTVMVEVKAVVDRNGLRSM